MIAALFIDPRGPYPRLADVDCWGVDRDARKYRGPHPVVAHPPCGPWGRLKAWCGERRFIDADCMRFAVRAVRRFGGVLEQPAHSAAFRAFRMPHPHEGVDEHGGATIALTQVEWGHVARKPTWLYLVRVPSSALESPPPPAVARADALGGRSSHRTRERRRAAHQARHQGLLERAAPPHSAAVRGLLGAARARSEARSS